FESWPDFPSRTFQSAPLTLAVIISTTISPDAATGSGISPNFRTSGPPCRSMKAAFIVIPRVGEPRSHFPSTHSNRRIRPARRAHGSYPLNDAALSKRRNRSRVIAECGQDKIGMLAKHRRTRYDFTWRFRQTDGSSYDRCGYRQARIIDILHEAGGANMRMIQRLLRAEHRSGRNHRSAQRVDRLLRGALDAPARHPLADDRAVVAALDIVRKARIAKPLVLLTHQPGPANEQRMTRDLAQHPAVPGAVNVGRRGGL